MSEKTTNVVSRISKEKSQEYGKLKIVSGFILDDGKNLKIPPETSAEIDENDLFTGGMVEIRLEDGGRPLDKEER